MAKNIVKAKKGGCIQNGKLDITFLSFVLFSILIGRERVMNHSVSRPVCIPVQEF